MSNASRDESGETNYLHSSHNRKDDSGDDSAGEKSYLTNNGKGPDPDDRRTAAGGGVAGSNIGGSSSSASGEGASSSTSGGGASHTDLGSPATAAAEPVPAWIAVLGNFLGQLIATKLDQALEGRIPAALPQPSKQAATSEQPPAIQPAPLEPHQHLPPQHCQGGSAAASRGLQHPAQQGNSRSNYTSIINHSTTKHSRVNRARSNSIRHSSLSRTSSRARVSGLYRW